VTQKFLITGLPRSRTAWFAALASSQSNSICFHEPIAQSASWEESLAVWQTPGYVNVGIADSGLGFHLEEILHTHFPRTLLIVREVAEVERSLANIGVVVPGFCQILYQRLASNVLNPLVKLVAFERLTRPEVVEGCLGWVLPGVKLDRRKIELFCELQIQTSMAAVKSKLRRHPAAIQDILGEDVVRELEGWRV
jgi:hypothetical protein